MLYINLETQEYPLSESQVRADFPNTSFPAVFPCPEGYAVVSPASVPTYDPITQYYREVAPEQIAGKWYQNYEITTLPDEQITANQAAAKLRLIESVTASTQARLDEFAKTRNYDGILSACTYASSTVTKFQSEGQYCVNARDATWATLYTIMSAVEAGTHAMPGSYADIEAELPDLAWPT